MIAYRGYGAPFDVMTLSGYHGYRVQHPPLVVMQTPGGPDLEFVVPIEYGMGYAGYGQGEEPLVGEGPEMPTREEVLAATAAADAAAKQAELQMALAQQQQSFNSQIIAGFIASAALGIMMWGIGQAVRTGEK